MFITATSPMRDKEDIQGVYAEVDELKAKAVANVCEVEQASAICNVLSENMDMNGFISTPSNKRRQEIEKFWRINGAIYFADVDFLLENTFLYRKGCYGYMMKQSHSIDIELDFVIAESVMKKFSGGITRKIICPRPTLYRRCAA